MVRLGLSTLWLGLGRGGSWFVGLGLLGCRSLGGGGGGGGWRLGGWGGRGGRWGGGGGRRGRGCKVGRGGGGVWRVRRGPVRGRGGGREEGGMEGWRGKYVSGEERCKMMMTTTMTTTATTTMTTTAIYNIPASLPHFASPPPLTSCTALICRATKSTYNPSGPFPILTASL